MQATFERFDSYDFETDANFQAGLKSILTKQQDKPAAEQNEAIENAKFFYFSRFVEAFDLNDYRAWKTSGKISSEESSAMEAGQEATQKSVVSSSQPSQSSSEPTYPKSFQEICELIASGQPIPGIRQIPNNLAEGTPSETKMAPRRKPWEKAAKVQEEQK